MCVWQVARMHGYRCQHNGSTCRSCEVSFIDLLALFLPPQRQGTWGPFLIVSPASTLHNWQQECTRFVPHFKVSQAREKLNYDGAVTLNPVPDFAQAVKQNLERKAWVRG